MDEQRNMNVLEALQSELRRVRDELIPAYEEIGPAGMFGKLMLQQEVRNAEAAVANFDVVQMVAALESLRGCQ